MLKKLKLNRTFSVPGLTADFPAAMAIIFGVFVLVVLRILFTTNLHTDLLPHVIAVSALVVIFPFASSYMKWIYGLLNPVSSDITGDVSYSTSSNMVEEIYKKAYKSWNSYIVPFLFAVIGFFTLTNMVGLPWLVIPKAAISYQLLLGIVLLLAGSIGWQFFCFLVFLYKLSRFEYQKIEPFQYQKQEFKKLHDVVIRVVVLGIFVYLSAIVTIWLVPWGQTILFSNPFGYFWAFPLAITVMLYFFASEYFLHSLLQNVKDLRLQKIDSLIKAAYEKWSVDSSGDSVNMFSELMKWREIINQEATWAINFQATLTVISSVLLPAIGIMIDVVSRL